MSTPHDTDHAATRDDVFSWLHNMQHDDDPEYLREAADLVLSAYDALAAGLEEAKERTLEERGLIVCPICEGNTSSGIDDPSKMEPAYVNFCHACQGHGYVSPARFMGHLRATEYEDVMGATVAAQLTEEEQGWL